MNWEAIGAIAELLGAIGVIATLAYLAVQIGQNTASNRNVALQTISAQDTDWLALVNQSPSLADIMLRAGSNPESLTPEERYRFGVLLTQLCRIYETRLQLHVDGAVPDAIWEASLRTLEFVSPSPSFRAWWHVQRQVFSDDLQKLVNEIISNTGSENDAA